MIKCGEDCIPSCESCKYVYEEFSYSDCMDEFIAYTCTKGNEEVHSKGYCEEFHCLNAERSSGKC